MNELLRDPVFPGVLAPVRYLSSDITISRKRLLPIPGKVLVRLGQDVQASDPVASAVLDPSFIWMNLARGLGIQSLKVEEYLQVKPGEQVFDGSVLAGPVGPMRRVFRSPLNGWILQIKNGCLLLQVETESFLLKAGYTGFVTDLIGQRGVEIQANGALIQGVWGNGKFVQAELAFLPRSPNQSLLPQALGSHLTNRIVIGGHCEHLETLLRAAALPVGGLILASIHPGLLDEVSGTNLPVMIVEGFGKHPFSPFLFQLLDSLDNREGVLNSQELMVFSGKPGKPAPVEQLAWLEPGQRVRLSSGPYFGKLGILTRLPALAEQSASNQFVYGEIKLDSGDLLVYPLRNLEIIRS